MKSLSTLILVAALSLVSLAQRAQNNTDEALKARNAPDVFVYTASAIGSDGQRSSRFTIEVGNTGAKAIRAIEWEYHAPGPVAGYGDRLKVRSGNLSLKPKDRKSLTKEFPYYTAGLVTSFNLSTVRIMRVEYDDGSIWQRSADDK